MAETASTPDSQSEPAPPLRFGLRGLLALVTLCGVASGLMAWAGLPPVLNVLLLVMGVLPLGLLLWRRRFVAAGWFCLFWLAVAFLLPAVSSAGPAARRAQCSNNLKQIALALHYYHDDYGSFPPAYIANEQGRPMHSWRVFLLPYLEEQAVYAQYRFDEPWNSPHNAKLAARMPDVFHCPSDKNAAANETSYVAVVGPGTAWPGARGTKLGDFADGASGAILLVEVADSGIHWLEPRDLHLAQMAPTINAPRGQGPSSKHEGGSGGINVVFADGHTAFLANSLSRENLRALLTIDGGEKVEP